MLFTRKQQPRFEALRAEIESAILAASTDRQPASAANGSLAEQLAQLARLHASGALSDQEFDAAKARLLLMLLLAEGGDVRARFEEGVSVLGGW